MDQPGFVFFGAIFGLTVGVPLLAVYIFGLFRYGQTLAEKVPYRMSDRKALILLSAAWFPISSLALLIPGGPFFKLLYWVVVYLMNAYPSAVGLISRRQYLLDQRCKRNRRNVDEWLAVWECEETKGILEDDWKAILQGGEDTPPS